MTRKNEVASPPIRVSAGMQITSVLANANEGKRRTETSPGNLGQATRFQLNSMSKNRTFQSNIHPSKDIATANSTSDRSLWPNAKSYRSWIFGTTSPNESTSIARSRNLPYDRYMENTN